jgi:hypothetical protein
MNSKKENSDFPWRGDNKLGTCTYPKSFFTRLERNLSKEEIEELTKLKNSVRGTEQYYNRLEEYNKKYGSGTNYGDSPCLKDQSKWKNKKDKENDVRKCRDFKIESMKY